MSGEVGDGKHFVAQRWHQKQIDLGEDTRHLLRHFAPKPVGLHVIDGGKKSGLPKNVRPSIRSLHSKLTHPAIEPELLKRCRAFGKENQIQRAIRPVWYSDFNWNHTHFLSR